MSGDWSSDVCSSDLKRALYIDQDYVIAHFALGNMNRQAGRKKEAERNFGNALRILERQEPCEVLYDAEGMTAGRQFLLSGETYAIETSFIAETFPLVDFTPLFCTPPFVVGIINVRGRIVSIVDMRRFFDLPVVGLSNLNRVIVVRDGKMEFGILADSIIGVRSLPLQDLQASLPTLTGIREEFLTGITADRLVLLDMGKILADRRLVVHEEVE